MAFLYIVGLVIAAASVSVLGAAFSIFGLSKLFSGSATAVAAMASALEFSKFVAAAFLHRTWKHLNSLYRTYLLVAVIVLSGITSMGIFGFLSNAYQTSSVDLTANQIQIDSLKAEQQRNQDQLAEITKSIDEIPSTWVTKRMQAQKQAAPQIQALTARTEQIAENLKQMELKNLEVKKKVGPLIYVAKAFHEDIDTVVKWLILVFVSVFDPLAICLVIATSEALKLRETGLLTGTMFSRTSAHVIHEPQALAEAAPRPSTPAPTVGPGQGAASTPLAGAAPAGSVSTANDSDSEDLVRMRYTDDPESKAS